VLAGLVACLIPVGFGGADEGGGFALGALDRFPGVLLGLLDPGLGVALCGGRFGAGLADRLVRFGAGLGGGFLGLAACLGGGLVGGVLDGLAGLLVLGDPVAELGSRGAGVGAGQVRVGLGDLGLPGHFLG